MEEADLFTIDDLIEFYGENRRVLVIDPDGQLLEGNLGLIKEATAPDAGSYRIEAKVRELAPILDVKTGFGFSIYFTGVRRYDFLGDDEGWQECDNEFSELTDIELEVKLHLARVFGDEEDQEVMSR